MSFKRRISILVPVFLLALLVPGLRVTRVLTSYGPKWILYYNSHVAIAQQVFDVSCSSGLTPVPSFLYGAPNGHLIANACVDVNGKITLQPAGGFAALSLFNGIFYVGTGTTWAGSDIGAQINTAYAACPTASPSGCNIVAIPGAYNYSTGIQLNTANKPVRLICAPGAGTNSVPQFGVTLLNWTVNTGTAIKIGPMSTGTGIDGCLLRGTSVASSSIGIELAGTQTYGLELHGIDVSGFNIGLQADNGAGPIAGQCRNCQIHDNLTNEILWQAGAGAESFIFDGGSLGEKTLSGFSASCIQINGVPLTSISFHDLSIDQCGVTITYTGALGTTISFARVHWENPTVSTANDFLTVNGAGSGGKISLEDCEMEEDFASARTQFISVTNASHLQVMGGWYQAINATTSLINANNAADVSTLNPYTINITNPVNTGFTGAITALGSGSGGVSGVSGTWNWGCPPGASNCPQLTPNSGTTVSGIAGSNYLLNRAGVGNYEGHDSSGNVGILGRFVPATYGTASNCSSSASPAVCGSASAGSFVLAAAATTVTVNTTAVTANSQIIVVNDDSLGTKLGVTCNTALDQVFVSGRVAATSFTITGTAPVTNPNCYSYTIVN